MGIDLQDTSCILIAYLWRTQQCAAKHTQESAGLSAPKKFGSSVRVQSSYVSTASSHRKKCELANQMMFGLLARLLQFDSNAQQVRL